MTVTGRDVDHRDGPGEESVPRASAPPPPSPRPAFDEATHVPYTTVTRHLWGDASSGEVPDWIYVSSDKIHHLVFGLAPGGRFQHSEDFRTVFAADELLYVLEGEVAFANPETGEVVPTAAGDAVFFRRDTWHHAFNLGPGAVRVLEFFAPPPATGASSAYARTKEYLAEPRYRDDRWHGRVPMASSERADASSIRQIRDDDVVWALDGGALVGTYVSTEHLVAGRVELAPGAKTSSRRHEGDATLHVVDGVMNVLLGAPDSSGQRWFEVHREDAFYVPAGVAYDLRNITGEPARAMLAVAPGNVPL
ncbi:MAG TPA: cupin domain-containing protein [Actinomycetota bacterium]|nr:cupin domain-containing protein [Actinomycetota bacterium]